MGRFVGPGAYARYRPVVVVDDLAALRGPATGRVTLPHHLYWGPAPVFDLSNPNRRAWLYSIVLSEALTTHDLAEFLNADVIVSSWRSLVLPQRVRIAWENQFTALAA